jgi:pyridoxine 5-phosphate synthase
MPRLGVNIDHIATLREARKISVPDPLRGVEIAEKAGADSVVAHLRQDRRHIKESDMLKMREIITTRLNMEMSVNSEIVQLALKIKPNQATLVPENRQEITTEGGLDVVSNFEKIKKVVDDLKTNDIIVSLFIDPQIDQIEASMQTGAEAIELHTGEYANAVNHEEEDEYLQEIKNAVALGLRNGLIVHAGHGLNYKNVRRVAEIEGIEELNIGHSIISEAIFIGLENAVSQMKKLITL